MKDLFFDKYLSRIVEILPKWLMPNMITTVRLFFVIPVIFLLILKMWAWFAVFYILSLFSDLLDGKLARVRGKHSKFGATFDPVVDKLLHWGIFCVYLPFYPLLISIVIVLDIVVAIGGLIVILYYKKKKLVLPILGANIFGKLKVTAQSLCVAVFIYRDLFSHSNQGVNIVSLFLLITILFSCLSIFDYITTLNKN